jgi:hypothetical protein
MTPIILAWIGSLLGVGFIFYGSKKKEFRIAKHYYAPPKNIVKQFLIITGILLIIIAIVVINIELHVYIKHK